MIPLAVMVFRQGDCLIGVRYDPLADRYHGGRVCVWLDVPPNAPSMKGLLNPLQIEAFGNLVYRQSGPGHFKFYDGNHWVDTGKLRRADL